MIIDAVSIAQSQIDALEKECEKLELEIDQNTRMAISILIKEQALENAHFVIRVHELQKMRLQVENEINHISAQRLQITEEIKAIRALQPMLDQGEYPDWLDRYIERVKRMRIDL